MQITSSGLATDYSVSTTETGYDFNDLAAAVTPNVTSQGGRIDVDSIRVFTVMEPTTVPEPGSLSLICCGAFGLLARRRRS